MSATLVTANQLAHLRERGKRYEAIENMVLEGINVNMPSANFGASVKGVFDGQADSFDPSRHQLKGTVSPGKRFRKAIKE